MIDAKRHTVALPHDTVTLPELLDAAPHPWSTLALGKWHLSVWADADHARDPLTHGFDHFAGTLDNLTVTTEVVDDPGYYRWQKTVDGTTFWVDTYATTDTVDEALARIPALPEPWLVYVAFHAVHRPFQLPPRALLPSAPPDPGEDLAAHVHAMAEALDTEVGRLLDGLGPLRERTTVVFTGDNGTTGEAILPPLDPERDKLTLYDGGVRVPLIVSGPAVPRPGESEALVHLVDVFPTVAELAGLDPGAVTDAAGAPVPLDGHSLVPLLADPRGPWPREVLYAERFQPNGPPPHDVLDNRMVRDARYKLVRQITQDRFFRYAPGAVDEGPDLLAGGLSPDEQAAYDRLSAELERITAGLSE